jgi:hypothetical protein
VTDARTFANIRAAPFIAANLRRLAQYVTYRRRNVRTRNASIASIGIGFASSSGGVLAVAPHLRAHHLLERSVWRERSCVRVDVSDLRRPDDLPFGIARRDLVPLGHVACAYPFASARIAVAEGEELKTGIAHSFNFNFLA